MRSLIKNLIKTRRKIPDDGEEKLFIDSMLENDHIDEEEVIIYAV